MIQMNLQNRRRHTDKVLVAGEGGGEGIVREFGMDMDTLSSFLQYTSCIYLSYNWTFGSFYLLAIFTYSSSLLP